MDSDSKMDSTEPSTTGMSMVGNGEPETEIASASGSETFHRCQSVNSANHSNSDHLLPEGSKGTKRKGHNDEDENLDAPVTKTARANIIQTSSQVSTTSEIEQVCDQDMNNLESDDLPGSSQKCSGKNSDASSNSHSPAASAPEPECTCGLDSLAYDSDSSNSSDESLLSQMPTISQLVKLQNRHIAKSIVDNAINSTLEDMGLSPSSMRPMLQLARQQQHVENAGVSQAINTQGLQRPRQSDLPNSVVRIMSRVQNITSIAERVLITHPWQLHSDRPAGPPSDLSQDSEQPTATDPAADMEEHSSSHQSSIDDIDGMEDSYENLSTLSPQPSSSSNSCQSFAAGIGLPTMALTSMQNETSNMSKANTHLPLCQNELNENEQNTKGARSSDGDNASHVTERMNISKAGSDQEAHNDLQISQAVDQSYDHQVGSPHVPPDDEHDMVGEVDMQTKDSCENIISEAVKIVIQQTGLKPPSP